MFRKNQNEERFLEYLARIAHAVEKLANAKDQPLTAVKIQIETGVTKPMNPVLILDSATNRIFVIGVDSAGASGAQLNSGDSVSVSIDDPTIATLIPDATPQADPNGNQSVYSGVVAPVTPIQTAKPFNSVATATIGGTAQGPVSLALQWKAGAAASILEEVN